MNFIEICAALAELGSDAPELEAALLAEKYCGISRAAVISDRKRELDSAELREALKKRAEHIPLQYILGEWYFASERYEVSEDCLIPRPDTELLVETAVRLLPKGAVFADLCTGSGCVAISTLARRSDTRAVMVDLFPRTLALAERNAALNGVSDRARPLRADVLKPIDLGDNAPLDALISNPPYIKSAVIDTLSPEVLREPRAALDGGEDGLDFYRAILSLHTNATLLKPSGFIAFEIGYDEGADITLLASSFGFSAEVIKDLGGNDRVAVLRRHDL